MGRRVCAVCEQPKLIYGIYIKAPAIQSGFYTTIPPIFRELLALVCGAPYVLGGAMMDGLMDTLVLTLGISLFAISIAYVTVCERL